MLMNARLLAPFAGIFVGLLFLGGACSTPTIGGGPIGGAGGGGSGGAVGGPDAGSVPGPDPTGGSGGGGGAPDASATGNGGSDAARDVAAAPVDMRPPTADGPVNPPAQPPGPWARGVEIALVEVAQVVFVKLGSSDTPGQAAMPLPVAMRNAPLIEGKPLFFRVHVRTTAGFMARQLRAVLTTEFAGSKLDLEATKMVTASSTSNDLNSTFNFTVPPDKVKADGAVAVSVYETGMPAGPEPTLLPKFGGELGVKGGKMEVHVVVVPSGITSDTPERRAKLAADFTDLYPIQKVNIRIGEPATIANFTSSSGFALLRDRKMAEMGKAYEYYHLIISTSAASYAGVATGGRIAITITRNPNLDGNTNTFAHEIGHNHGLSHMPGCGASGSDMNYPYVQAKAPAGVTWPAGFMGVNGYSISTNTLKPTAMFRELMSYCRPRWVSDYVYKKFEERVRMVMATVPATMMLEAEQSMRSLQGWAGPGENINFGLAPGRLVDESTTAITPDRHAVLTLTDGSEVKVPVAVSLATDDVTEEFAINLDGDKYGADDVVMAEVVTGSKRTVVDVAPMSLRSKRRK